MSFSRAQYGGSWSKALSRLDLSYTGVTDVACLAPVEAPDGRLFRGCPELFTLTVRGCKGVEAEVRKRSLVPALVFNAKTDRFAKTGSGRT